MKNKIITDLFWFNSIGEKLQNHTEALTNFASVVLYRLFSFKEKKEEVFHNYLVKKTLYNLTLSVHSLYQDCGKKDIASAVRLVLADYLEDYHEFEKYLLTQIPKITTTQVLVYNIDTSNPSNLTYNEKESLIHIKKELERIGSKLVSNSIF